MRIPVVIPAYEPDNNLITLCGNLINNDITDIIIVDDGSGEEYSEIFSTVKTKYNCTILTHDINKGKGRALKDAFEFLLSDNSLVGCVTADSDGQHSVNDIKKCIDALIANPQSLILGCRNFSGDNVPTKSAFGNNLTRNVCRLLCSVNVSDTQTGLRAIPKDFMNHLLSTSGERFEFETNMLIETKDRVSIVEVPIETIYDSKDNHKTHFRAVVDSIRIYRIFGRIFAKYLVSSLSSSVIDLIIFQTICHFTRDSIAAYITIATVIARIISATCNYMFNHLLVFKSNKAKSITFGKYASLAIIQMFASALFVYLGVSILPNITESYIKIVVDVILFFISYKIQQKFIF